MRRIVAIAWAAMALALGMAAYGAEPVEHAAVFGEQAEPVAGEFDALKRALTLTDAQQGKLKAICDGLEQDLIVWEAATMKRWKVMEAEFAVLIQQSPRNQTGPTPTPPDQVAEEQQMAAERQKIVDAAQGAIWKELTPEQRGTWAGFQVMFRIGHRLHYVVMNAGLTAAQIGRIEKSCQEAGKGFEKGTKPWTAEELDAACMRVMRQVVADILSDAQVSYLLGMTTVRGNPYLDGPWAAPKGR